VSLGSFGKGDKMKKGLIVYLTDSNTLPMTFDADEALTSLSLSCDHSVLAAASRRLL
jgi:hypothetical protein